MRAFSIVVALLVASPAIAWDPVGDVTKGRVFRNIEREVSRGANNVGRETERIWNQGRTDLSNGLNRIDPRITQFGRDLDRMRLEFQSSVFTGPALEQWFIQSRNDSMNGAQPMPWEMRGMLQGWFDDDIMSKVRFKVGDGGELNLANNSIRYGDARAVTLIDVVVFRNAEDARDPSLWAHELHHVKQFRDWGVRNFAIRYMRSWNSVENEAYAVERQFAANQVSRGQYATQPPQQYQSPLYQPQYMAAPQAQACMTQFGVCGLRQPTLPGSQCGCQWPNGAIAYGNAR